MFAWPIARKPWQHTYIRAASVADRDCVPATVVADMQLLHEAKDNDTLFGQIWNMSLYMKLLDNAEEIVIAYGAAARLGTDLDKIRSDVMELFEGTSELPKLTFGYQDLQPYVAQACTVADTVLRKNFTMTDEHRLEHKAKLEAIHKAIANRIAVLGELMLSRIKHFLAEIEPICKSMEASQEHMAFISSMEKLSLTTTLLFKTMAGSLDGHDNIKEPTFHLENALAIFRAIVSFTQITANTKGEPTNFKDLHKLHEFVIEAEKTIHDPEGGLPVPSSLLDLRRFFATTIKAFLKQMFEGDVKDHIDAFNNGRVNSDWKQPDAFLPADLTTGTLQAIAAHTNDAATKVCTVVHAVGQTEKASFYAATIVLDECRTSAAKLILGKMNLRSLADTEAKPTLIQHDPQWPVAWKALHLNTKRLRSMLGNVAPAQKMAFQAMLKYAEDLLAQEKQTMEGRWKRDIELLTSTCSDLTPHDWMVWMVNKPDKTKLDNFASDERVLHLPVLSASSLKQTTKIAKQFGDDEGAWEWNKTHVAMLDRGETVATQTKLMLAVANAADVLHNKVPVATTQEDKKDLVAGAKALINKLKVAALIPKQLLDSFNEM